MSRAKNPKYESMSLEELRANMEKSKKELEHAIHNKNILEQRKRIVERKERSHKSIVRQVYIAALHKEQQQIAEAVERAEKGDDS